mmetsp:Transcript_26758/g.87671  ORF Transcript_26758/g.87671 Transcript_26758/m.87671 type:complete len:432 (-) Transcript_26758:76-1371(-)
MKESTTTASGCNQDKTMHPEKGSTDEAQEMIIDLLTQKELEKKRMINWCRNATIVHPKIVPRSARSILQAASMAVLRHYSESFCCSLLHDMHTLLNQKHHNFLLNRWLSDMKRRGGILSFKSEWNEIANLNPLAKRICKPIYLMALAHILQKNIIVVECESRRHTGKHSSPLKVSSGVQGIYLPLDLETCSQEFLMFAFIGNDVYLLEAPENASKVMFPLVTCKGSLLPVKFLKDTESEDECLKSYLSVVAADVFPNLVDPDFPNGVPVLCAQFERATVSGHLDHSLTITSGQDCNAGNLDAEKESSDDELVLPGGAQRVLSGHAFERTGSDHGRTFSIPFRDEDSPRSFAMGGLRRINSDTALHSYGGDDLNVMQPGVLLQKCLTNLKADDCFARSGTPPRPRASDQHDSSPEGSERRVTFGLNETIILG